MRKLLFVLERPSSPLRRAVSRTTAIQVYKALFESQLRYCILCYGSASQTAINSIEILQNRVVRRLMGFGDRVPAERLYSSSSIMSLKHLYLQRLLFECHVRNSSRTEALLSDLTGNHSYPTRHATMIRTPATKFKRSDRYYMNRYAKIYKTLNPPLRNWREDVAAASKKKANREAIASITHSELNNFFF